MCDRQGRDQPRRTRAAGSVDHSPRGSAHAVQQTHSRSGKRKLPRPPPHTRTCATAISSASSSARPHQPGSPDFSVTGMCGTRCGGGLGPEPLGLLPPAPPSSLSLAAPAAAAAAAAAAASWRLASSGRTQAATSIMSFTAVRRGEGAGVFV